MSQNLRSLVWRRLLPAVSRAQQPPPIGSGSSVESALALFRPPSPPLPVPCSWPQLDIINNSSSDERHPPPAGILENSCEFLRTMWKLSALYFVISALINVRRTVTEDQRVFRKCCAQNESLAKFTGFHFECIDSESANRIHNISLNIFSQIVLSDDVPLNYGFPGNCTLQMLQMDEVELIPISDDASHSKCYDKIILEKNGSQLQIISKIVTLTCEQNNSETLQPQDSKVNVDLLRKCCPPEEAYDSEHHVCRPMEEKIVKEESTVEWLLPQLTLNSSSYIYNVETGLNCKSVEYSVELSANKFSLQLEGSVLKVFKDREIRAARGDWCIDRDYYGSNVIARVCTQDCSQYGAYCFRKCCPIGEHYKPHKCHSVKSTCTKSVKEEVFLNMSIYFDPLEAQDGNLLGEFYVFN